MRILCLAFVVALTGAMTPGPFLALVIGQVLAQGLASVAFLLLGHACLEAVLVAGMAKGLGRWLAIVSVRAALGIVGGAVLLWMGWEVFSSAGSASLAAAKGTAMSWLPLFLAGMGASLSNPYFTGWWATVGTGQVATLGLRSREDYALFLVGHELGDVLWYVLVGVALTWGRHWLTDDIYRWLLWICGGVILLLGALFVGIGCRLLLKARGRRTQSN
jgi:threonine/homoserine/homoserine lactone efflux protein